MKIVAPFYWLYKDSIDNVSAKYHRSPARSFHSSLIYFTMSNSKAH